MRKIGMSLAAMILKSSRKLLKQLQMKASVMKRAAIRETFGTDIVRIKIFRTHTVGAEFFLQIIVNK